MQLLSTDKREKMTSLVSQRTKLAYVLLATFEESDLLSEPSKQSRLNMYALVYITIN
jgi:hypothetical protein